MNTSCTAEVDVMNSVKPSDIDILLSDTAGAIHSTYYKVQNTSPGGAIFGRDMLFDIPYIADSKKIGENRQQLNDLNNANKNEGRIDYDYQAGQKVLVRNNGILCKAESRYQIEPCTIMSVQTNGTIREGSMWKQIWKDKYLESKTVSRIIDNKLQHCNEINNIS